MRWRTIPWFPPCGIACSRCTARNWWMPPWVRSRIQASVTPASVSSRETVVSSWALPGSSDRPVARDGTRDVPEYAGLASDVRAERQQRLAGVAEPRQAYLPAVAQEEVRPLGQIASRYLVAQVGDEIQIGEPR